MNFKGLALGSGMVIAKPLPWRGHLLQPQSCLADTPCHTPKQGITHAIKDDEPLAVRGEAPMSPSVAVGIGLADQPAAVHQRPGIKKPHLDRGRLLSTKENGDHCPVRRDLPDREMPILL